MKYVFLAYRDAEQWDAMSTRERGALESACQASEQDLRQSGHLLAIGDLLDSRSAITVRIVNGKVSLTGGPLAGVQGLPIRLFCIDARDLNEAIRLAAQMPQARGGPIEVRPLVEPDRPSITG